MSNYFDVWFYNVRDGTRPSKGKKQKRKLTCHSPSDGGGVYIRYMCEGGWTREMPD